ncbi:hypothetical protein PHJA_002609500 [Phtheirospermum japonicum]|uniref:Uncharacterized protein n=1 Tax=Phtheirospermum japonicum TaxID=374723 RepID=A0A830D809_9LAMI|nr:hypothetical protein PHJA_002609500 [Phtheirospermum japonicum]
MRTVTPFLFVGFFIPFLELPLARSSVHDLIYKSQRVLLEESFGWEIQQNSAANRIYFDEDDEHVGTFDEGALFQLQLITFPQIMGGIDYDDDVKQKIRWQYKLPFVFLDAFKL